MTLARPEWLFAWLPFAALLAGVLTIRHRHARAMAAALGRDQALQLWPGGVPALPMLRGVVLALSGMALVVAAAGPGVSHGSRVTPASPLALTVVVDVSPSMAASDVAPSRIGRAGEALSMLAKELPQSSWTILTVGDWPATLLPTTDDARVAGWFARALSPGLVAELAAGIRTGRGDEGESLDQLLVAAREAAAAPSSTARRIILVLSDGALKGDPSAIEDEVRRSRALGFSVWTAGVGSRAGTAIELNGRPFVTGGDSAVKAGLDFTPLRQLAQRGGGRFLEINDSGGIEDLVSELRAQAGQLREEDVGPRRAQQWLCAIALLLLAIERWADARQRRVAGLNGPPR